MGPSAVLVGAVWDGGPGYVIDFTAYGDNQTMVQIYIAENIIYHWEAVLNIVLGYIDLYHCLVVAACPVDP